MLEAGQVITLYDIVLSFPHAVDTLDKFNLDYYCGGAKPFLVACAEKKLDAAKIWAEILAANPSGSSWAQSWRAWEPDILSDLILRHYNDFRSKEFSVSEVLGRVVQDCFTSEAATLHSIDSCFKDLREVFTHHTIAEEEALLFPLGLSEKGGNRSPKIHPGDLGQFEKDHVHLGGLIKSLRHLTSNYTMEGLSSPLVPLVGILLQGFDKDLTQRLHLENNILFPKLKS